MKKSLAENDCHYYQFFFTGNNFPIIKVSSGKIQYWIKPGRAESEVDPSAIVKLTPSSDPWPITLPIHDEERLYSLFVKGLNSGGTYELFPVDSEIATRRGKDLNNLTSDVLKDGCIHQSFS